jgi:hypothetical protein
MSKKSKKNKKASLPETGIIDAVNTEASEMTETDSEVSEKEPTGEGVEESGADESGATDILPEVKEEMTELTAGKDNRKYTDDELEEMDSKRMAHVIMNDENRTDMDLLGEVFKDDAYSLKLKKKEAKKLAKEEKRRKSGETGGVRFLGTMAVLMAVAGVALVLLTVYFLAIAPTYNKNEYLANKLTFPDSAVLSQGDYTQMKEGYYEPEIATDDAEMELGGEEVE